MKIITSKVFRARMAEFSRMAENGDTIFITRPGKKLLKLTIASEEETIVAEDLCQIERSLQKHKASPKKKQGIFARLFSDF